MSGWFALLGVLVGSALTAGTYEWTRRPTRRNQTKFDPCPWCRGKCTGHFR